MELSYLISAIRKRPWIVAIFLVLGALAATTVTGPSVKEYEAQSVMLIQPPSNLTGGGGSTDANRYLQSQLSVLRSLDLAEKTASTMGGSYTRQQVSTSVRVIERPGTDVVDVFAKAPTGVEAARLADVYVQTYIEYLRDQARASNSQDLDEINQKLLEFKQSLSALSATISLAKSAFITDILKNYPGLTNLPDVSNLAVPDAAIAQVDYDTTLQQYTELLKNRTALEAESRTKVATEVVQKAVEPTVPLDTTRLLYVVAGAIAGAVMGLFACVITARVSNKVVDDQQTVAVLGTALVGTVGRQNQLAAALPDLLRANDYPALNVIDELCVRSEANARRTGFVTVVVVGTGQSAGATTIATAMAGQFARFGTQVLLVDADPRRSGITEGFKAFGDGGIPALLATAPDGSLVAGRRTSDNFRRARSVITTTTVPEVAVLGRGDKSGSPSLRRSDAETLMERALTLAPVVVIDAGAVLDSASTVELCRLADAVVLAVPTQRQRVSQLEVVSRQLGRRQGELLPIATRPRRHRDKLSASSSVETDAVVTTVDDDDNVEINASNGDASPAGRSRSRPGRPGATTAN